MSTGTKRLNPCVFKSSPVRLTICEARQQIWGQGGRRTVSVHYGQWRTTSGRDVGEIRERFGRDLEGGGDFEMALLRRRRDGRPRNGAAKVDEEIGNCDGGRQRREELRAKMDQQ